MGTFAVKNFMSQRQLQASSDCYPIRIYNFMRVDPICVPLSSSMSMTVVPLVLYLVRWQVTASVSVSTLPSLSDVTMMGLVRLGSGIGQPPLVSIRGTLSTSGASTMQLGTTEPWQPLPGDFPHFTVPLLFGVMEVHTTGALMLQLTHSSTFDVDLVPGWLSLSSVQVSTQVAVESEASLVEAQLEVRANSSAKVAAAVAGGFDAKVTAILRPDTGAADLTLKHMGGWSPVQGPLSSIFRTPAFTCSAQLRTVSPPSALPVPSTSILQPPPPPSPPPFDPDPLLAFQCDIAHIPSLVFADGVLVVYGASTAIAMKLMNISDVAQWAVRLKGSLHVGSPHLKIRPPPLNLSGVLDGSGTSILRVSTETNWSPLPNVLNGLAFPALDGTVAMTSNGTLAVKVANPTPIASVAVVDVLELRNVSVGIDILPWNV